MKNLVKIILSILLFASFTSAEATCGSGQMLITVSCVDVQFATGGPFTKRVCGMSCSWQSVQYSTNVGSCAWCEDQPGMG